MRDETTTVEKKPTNYRMWVRVLLASLLSMVVAFVLTLVVVIHINNRELSKQAQEGVDGDFKSCLRANEQRQVLRDVIQVTFDRFPEQVSNPDSMRNQALSKTQPRPCERQYPNHTPGIRLPKEN